MSSHYAFLSPHTHGSTVMRAHLASVVVGMTGAFHNASGSFIRLHNVSAREERHDAEDHFKRHAHRTPLAACIFVKEVPSEDGAIRSCRRRGAPVQKRGRGGDGQRAQRNGHRRRDGRP